MIMFLRILLILLTLASSANAVTVTLSLKETAGVTRTSEYITFGVPLAESDNVTTLAGAKMSTDLAGSSPVDAQFEVLSRYGDVPGGTGAIRVALVSVAPSVTGSTTGNLYFHSSGGSGTVAGDNLITSDATHYLLDTGSLLIKVKKAAGFNLFDQVTVDATNVVSTPATDGVVLVDGYDDVTYTSYNSNDAPTITVEENGPLHAVLAVTGKLEDSSNNELVPKRAEYTGDSPILYTARYHIYKDSRTVKLQFTLKNENRGWAEGTAGTYGRIHSLQVDHLRLVTTMAGLGSPSAVRFGAGVVSGVAFTDDSSPSGTYTVYQNHPAHDADSSNADDFAVMSYQVGAVGSETTNSADRFDSFAQMRDANRGIMVAGRWFWENYWNRINLDATNKKIDNYLMADESFDQMFLGGSYKTWEFVYNFHGNVAADYSFSTELAALKNRLYAVPSNFASSNFFEFTPPNLASYDPAITWTNGGYTETLRSAVYAWNQANLAKFDSSAAQNQVSDLKDFDDFRQNRPFLWTAGIYNGNYMQWYGWRDFGGMARFGSYGYSGQHYNWSYISARTGIIENDPYILDIADQLAYTHVDSEMIHDPAGSPTDQVSSNSNVTALTAHGAQRYETDSHAQLGSFINQVSGAGNDVAWFAHQWTAGIALQYLMTGNKHFYDGLIDAGEKIKFNYSDLLVNGYKGGTYHATQVCYDDDSTPVSCYPNYGESRDFTRAIESAVHIYKVTGDTDYENIAEGIFNLAVIGNEINSDGILYYPTARAWTCSQTPDSHLLYDSLKIQGIISLWYSSSGATKTAIGNFLTRNANWAKDELYPNWSATDFSNPGTYATSNYWPYTAPNDWKSECEYTLANLASHPGFDASYSLPFADLFAWMYLQTETQSWMDLARKVFFDYWAYSGGTKAAETINQKTYTQIDVDAFDSTPANAWAKVGMTVEKPAYYLAVESGMVGGTPPPQASGLRLGNFRLGAGLAELEP